MEGSYDAGSYDGCNHTATVDAIKTFYFDKKRKQYELTYKGDKGAQGIQGIQGPEGPEGIQGIQGIQGDTGPRGDSN